MLKVEEIIQDLRKRGYTNKSIDYQEFLELYEPYGKEMSELEFAEIIGISYSNFMNIKHRFGKRAKVLKEEREIPEERKEEIRENIRKQGYTNKLIDYQEFLKLYNPYKNEFTETEFRKIIGIPYDNYMNIKNRGRRTKVLKEEKKIPNERKEEIREDIRKKGYRNKAIDYQEFLELYKPYKNEMKEKEFAEILEISYSNYMSIKNRGTKAIVLKEGKEIPEERKEEIREDLRKRGYTNKLIDYQEFLELYRPYQNEMSETEFVEVLGIFSFNYNTIKYYTRKRTKILKREIPNEREEEIREELRKQGYANKPIDYQELLELYKLYQNEMSEADFVKILGISCSNFATIKNRGTRAIVLKEEKIPNERKEEIREDIKKQGYTNKLINYQEFLELYMPYKKEMSEKEFAEILGISEGNYKTIKNRGTRAKVLKEKRKISEKREEEIREDLIKRGYRNKPIDYQEFLELYRPYQNEMKEKEFAEILDISSGSYNNMKNAGTRAKILKEKKDIPEERKEEIREDLIKRGYRNKSIDYQEFLKLYMPYKKEMSEKKFAEILGISEGNYKTIKNRGTRAKILKEKRDIPEERKEEIREDLRKQGYTNKLIDYQEILELYSSYKNEMTELEFAEILGISYNNYMTIKSKGAGTGAIVLKLKKNIPKERKEEIREDIRKQGYSNKLIDYQEFLELYKPYQNEMKESKFAEILGIPYNNFINIKNRGGRTKVLKEKKDIPEERKEEIREDLIKRGYRNKPIDYQEFLELYRPYQNEMKEKEFAEILRISEDNYMNIKNRGTRAKILKVKRDIPEERKEEIREDLKKRGYSSKIIDYQEFLELYSPYQNEMSETEFIEILGISHSNYMNVKKRRTRAKINFSYKKLRRIRYKLSLDSREYKKEELEQLCKKYGLTLEELLIDIFSNTVVERLMNKEKIYIGKCKIPDSFLSRHSEELLHMSQKLSKKICRKYNFKSDIEDMASEALMIVIERRGDIVINTETEEEALNLIRRYMSKIIKNKYIARCKVRGTLSLDESISDNGRRTRYEIVKAPQKTEVDEDKRNETNETNDDRGEESAGNEKSEGSIVEDMKMCYEKGMKNSEAIAYVRKKYGISRKELLKILEQELSKKRRIVKSPTGKVYLGEEYDD